MLGTLRAIMSECCAPSNRNGARDHPGIRKRAKNGEPNVVPLNDLAIAVLDGVARGSKWPRSGRVFATSTGHNFTAYNKGKKKIDKLLTEDGGDRVPGWRLHDLRRTVATGFQRLGVRFEVTEAILNHVGMSRSGVAAIYQRHDWREEKQAALRLWSEHLQGVFAVTDVAASSHQSSSSGRLKRAA